MYVRLFAYNSEVRGILSQNSQGSFRVPGMVLGAKELG